MSPGWIVRICFAHCSTVQFCRFDRVKHLLPSKLGDENLLGLNRRWRFYRYYSGNL